MQQAILMYLTFYFILMSANLSKTDALFSGFMNVKDSLVTG